MEGGDGKSCGGLGGGNGGENGCGVTGTGGVGSCGGVENCCPLLNPGHFQSPPPAPPPIRLSCFHKLVHIIYDFHSIAYSPIV